MPKHQSKTIRDKGMRTKKYCIACGADAVVMVGDMPSCAKHVGKGVHKRDPLHEYKKRVRERDRRKVKLDVCIRCGCKDKKKLTRHHIRYTNPRIVVVLCKKCHILFH